MKGKRCGKKRENENQRRDHGKDFSFPPEGFYRLDDPGVAKAQKEQDYRPSNPAVPAEVSQRQQDQKKASRDISAFIAQDRIKDVAAIELPHREQV